MALAAEHGERVPALVRLGHRAVQILAHARVGAIVAVYHLLGLAHGDVQALPQAKRLLAVHDAEVHRLGAAAHFGRDVFHCHAEDPGRRVRVEILPALECRNEPFIAGKVGEQAQLYLRVIGRKEHAALGRDEGLADLAPQLRAHGDVLQVRV